MAEIRQFEVLSDPEIVNRILSGEIALYEIIMRRYNPYLFKIGKSYGFSQPDTEDLIQDSYLNAYTNLNKFENRSTLKTWLVKIMLNNCYHKTRKFSFKKEIPTEISEKNAGIPMFMQQTNTGKAIMNNELKHILEEALLQLPEAYRMVFTLRELNGMSTRETSETLNISEANVKVRLKRAKSILRNEIKKMYTPEEIFEFNLIYCNRIVENVLTKIQEKNN